MYNVLVGGAAGDGIETIVAVFEKALKRSCCNVYSVRDFMSRIRGGHNFTQVRFGNGDISSHAGRLDGIVAINEETVNLHKDRLVDNGFILCDTALKIDDSRAIKIDMRGIAKSLGNPKVAGSIAIGAVLKLFGMKSEIAHEIMRQTLKPEILEANLKAIDAGFNAVQNRYEHTGGNDTDRMLLSGHEALVLGALAANLRFYSAYPMSPSTSIMESLNAKKNIAQIVVEQAEDEIAAINMALGASYAGVRAMTGTSGGGFSLMVEALGFSGIAEIPIVIVDAQRPGPATGFPTRTEQSDLKFAISAAQGEFPRMVITLRNHNDVFYQTARAFDIAERYQIPVVLLTDQYLADTTTTVPLFDLSKVPPIPQRENEPDEEYLRYRITETGVSPRRIPSKSKAIVTTDSDEHDEMGCITESASMRVQMVDKRMRKIELLRQELQEPEWIGSDEYDTLLVGFGSTDGPIREAIKTLVEESPEKYGALVFGDIWPLPTQTVSEKAAKAKRIVNVEQNATGQLALLLREQTGIVCTENILKYDGRQISGEEIVQRLKEMNS